MENQTNKKGTLVAIITMMFLFAMISFVTNMAAPFGTIWKQHYEWAGMMGNMMNFLAYLFMGIPAGMMITKYGYKKTALVALALGFIGIAIQYGSSTMDGNAISTYIVYLLGAFVCGFCVCILNTVVNPMLNLLGGGGNRGNQLIQTGGSLNSLAATLTPMLAGSMISYLCSFIRYRLVYTVDRARNREDRRRWWYQGGFTLSSVVARYHCYLLLRRR